MNQYGSPLHLFRGKVQPPLEKNETLQILYYFNFLKLKLKIRDKSSPPPPNLIVHHMLSVPVLLIILVFLGIVLFVTMRLQGAIRHIFTIAFILG